jgi:hypothetical protein
MAKDEDDEPTHRERFSLLHTSLYPMAGIVVERAIGAALDDLFGRAWEALKWLLWTGWDALCRLLHTHG